MSYVFYGFLWLSRDHLGLGTTLFMDHGMSNSNVLSGAKKVVRKYWWSPFILPIPWDSLMSDEEEKVEEEGSLMIREFVKHPRTNMQYLEIQEIGEEREEMPSE
ncbi:hypothetical protein ScPMuIL_005747 [Solemya velum]